ncbi:7276_t:CDS:2, partial [Dentiscutata erythropus]
TQAYNELVDIIHHSQFKSEDVVMNISTYKCGEFIVYKELVTTNRFGQILAIVDVDSKFKITVQRILTFKELPNNLKSNNQRNRSYNELWLLDRGIENAVIVVELQNVVKIATIVILYNKNNINSSSLIFIREILYKHQGHWKLRDVVYAYKHPSEFAALEDKCFSNIILKKCIPKKKIEKKFPNNSTFRRKLALIYREIGYDSAFVEDSCQHYEISCFLENNGTDKQCLHIGDIVTIASEKGDSTINF